MPNRRVADVEKAASLLSPSISLVPAMPLMLSAARPSGGVEGAHRVIRVADDQRAAASDWIS
jgi:hypothetical protein